MRQAIVLCGIDDNNVVWRCAHLAREGHEEEEMDQAIKRVINAPRDKMLETVLNYKGFSPYPMYCDFYNESQQRCPGFLTHDKTRQGLHTEFYTGFKRIGIINFIYGPRRINGRKLDNPDLLHAIEKRKLVDALLYAENRDLCVACPQEPNTNAVFPVTISLYPASL